VRGQQDRGVLQVGQAVDHVVKVPPGLGVQAGRRLVQEQHLGPADDPGRDVQPAPLPAGQDGDLPVGQLAQPDRLDQVVHVQRALPVRCGVRRVVPAQVAQEFPDLPAAVVAPRLQDHADPGPPALVARRRVGPQHADLTGRADPEALQDLDGGGLPGAVRPEQDQYLTPGGGEVDSVQHIHRPVSHPQAADLDHGHGAAPYLVRRLRQKIAYVLRTAEGT
jgi:hypothetical protein